MVRGHLTTALTVILLVITGVQSECINNDNDDMLSLYFKKMDKVQDKHQDEITAMREKMQENKDGITEQMQIIRENVQEKIDGMREKMQEKIDGLTEKSQKMQEEIVRMKEKLQGQEEINELKTERIEKRCDQFENMANNKPSVDVNTVSSNEISLAMAVLQLSTSLDNFQTCRGCEDTDIEARLTEQMSRLIAPSSPSSESNVPHVDTAVNELTADLTATKPSTILVNTTQDVTTPNPATTNTTITKIQTTFVTSTRGVTTLNPPTTTTTITKSPTTVVITTPNPPTTTTERQIMLRTEYACEHKNKNLNIECEVGHIINVIYANYGRISHDICNPHGNTGWPVNCHSESSRQVIDNRCSGQSSCNVSASNAIFGDPCGRIPKYLEMHYACEPEHQTTFRTAYACEAMKMNITCEVGHVINVIYANYGRTSIDICNIYRRPEWALTWSINCHSESSRQLLDNRCSGQTNCNAAADHRIFGDPCVGTPKYLEMHYACEPVGKK